MFQNRIPSFLWYYPPENKWPLDIKRSRLKKQLCHWYLYESLLITLIVLVNSKSIPGRQYTLPLGALRVLEAIVSLVYVRAVINHITFLANDNSGKENADFYSSICSTLGALCMSIYLNFVHMAIITLLNYSSYFVNLKVYT